MGSLSLTAFLLIVFVQGAKAADKELSEACTSSDACVHPTLELVCDDITSTCRIKNGKACSGDGHGGLCVSGAGCDGSDCACETPKFAVNANGKCDFTATFWGAACVYDADNAAGDCDSSSSGLACLSGASPKCECVAAKLVTLATAICEDATKVGTTCADQTQCGDVTSTFLTCQSARCACKAGYSGVAARTCAASAQQTVGKVCSATNAAETTSCGPPATTNLECSNLACACKDGYYGVTGGGCVPAAGKLNGGCSGADRGTCADSDALCTGTGAKSCKRDLGGACTEKSDCADTNAECDAFAKTCLLKTDQTCTTKQDKCVSGASCDTTLTPNQCKCIAGVYTDTSNLCYATTAGKVTGTCKGADPKCDDTNAECNDSSTRCMCKTGFKLKNTDATCEKSGAITVIASALTVMLVSVSGHLIMLH